MPLTQINELAQHSTMLTFYWLFCPQCDFDVHIKSLGYSGTINFGQEVSCRCPNCKKMITKKVGINLGVMDENSSR